MVRDLSLGRCATASSGPKRTSILNKRQVSNDSVLQELVTTAINSGHSLKDKIFVDCSTVLPETVGTAVSKLKEKDAKFLSAPVFGGNPIAVDGKLVFAIGGPKQAAEVVKPFIQDVMGRKVIDCGEDAMKSSLLKIAGYVESTTSNLYWIWGMRILANGCIFVVRNIVTVNLMEAVGEAQVFAEKTGLGTGPMEDLIGEAFGGVAGGYSKR